MKKEELTALGLTEEQANSVLAMNGKSIEAHKKTITDLTSERDDLQGRLKTAEDTLKSFEGVDLEKIQNDIKKYQQDAADAQKHYEAQILAQDQKDWLKAKFDSLGVNSVFSRSQLERECMDRENGLKWKDGSFMGFDDFMKSAKEKDPGLYKTAEERQLEDKAPKFTDTTKGGAGGEKKFTPPKIF